MNFLSSLDSPVPVKYCTNCPYQRIPFCLLFKGKKEEDYQTTNSRERENHHPRWKKIILSRARRSEREREMLLEETSQMTRKIFLRTFQTLRSYFFGRWFHKNLPKAPPYNPFFCPTQNSNNNNPNTIQELDDFYRQFSELWDTQKKKKRKKKKNAISIEESITTSFIKFENQSYETNAQELVKEEKEIANFHEEEKGKDDDEERGEIEKGHELAVKLKKVVMEDENEGDADDALDIEEVLHCYSQITCPAYLGAVDKLLLDVHSEFLIPQPQPSPSVGVNNSTPRVGPLKL